MQARAEAHDDSPTGDGTEAEKNQSGRANGTSSTEQGPSSTGQTSGRMHAKGVRRDLQWLTALRNEYEVGDAWPCKWKQRKRLRHHDVTSRRKNRKDYLGILVTICACCNQPGPGPRDEARHATSGAGPGVKRPAPSGAPQGATRKSRRVAENRLLAQPEWQCEVEIAPLVDGAPPKRGTCAGDGEGGAGGLRNKRGVG